MGFCYTKNVYAGGVAIKHQLYWMPIFPPLPVTQDRLDKVINFQIVNG